MSEVNSILVAAHDLKAPLSLLRQLALSLELAPDAATRADLEGELVSVSERALRQVNDLVKIARLENAPPELEPVSVRGVCDRVYRELTPVFRHEGRRLELSYRNHSRLASASPELLHSIIFNFCTNALHYSNPETSSRLSIADADGQIRIAVRDFGPALPVKIYQQLNSGSLRRPAAIAMRPGSSGLGLFVASEFARHMRAPLRVVRHRDGTSFLLDLAPSKQASLF